ncbi:MAG TPA: polyribonucleotide nucleotidyltransferase [Syntrophaceae bacterium]|nr:polyribonucleotide nucleotidyltransferase [Syntrophaceae bacterium]
MSKCVETNLGGRMLAIEVGKVAKQANGSALVKYGETVVLVTAVASKEPRKEDFFPLTVDYQEMAFAVGKIPGGFFRREIGRPSERETLTSRLIDRALRPLFPSGYCNEVQIIATVSSADQENDPDTLAIIGASTALEISDVPFMGPVAGVRVGKIDGKLVVNPTNSQLKTSTLNLVVAGTKEAVVMVEGGSLELSEDEILDAIIFGHESLRPLVEIQEALKEMKGKEKMEVKAKVWDEALYNHILALSTEPLKEAFTISGKIEREKKLHEISLSIIEKLGEEIQEQEEEIASILYDIEKALVRDLVLKQGRRIDGRSFSEIRPITCEVGVLPRTHGSALFTRGETQALVVTTLGSSADEQRIESLNGDLFKSFMLHYNFPPYCTGEVKRLRGPGRREIGHGALAERAISSVLPSYEDFPYTIRVVSNILESNGSSSMATVCGASLSLMDAGVPIKTAVAGIAMGLMVEDGQVAILSDIIGDEDHFGDMDFKVSGTSRGITAIQMDIKTEGITPDIMRRALYQAREGRLFILEEMKNVIDKPRGELSPFAPKITTLEVSSEKVGDIIGPGGRTIKGIQAETGVKIDIEDTGRVCIVSQDKKANEKAVHMIKRIVQEVEVGGLYMGTVKKVTDFGAFVEILPGTDGLVHISQLDTKRVRRVTDIIREGDEVLVKVLGIDSHGKISLSRKAALGETLKDRS